MEKKHSLAVTEEQFKALEYARIMYEGDRMERAKSFGEVIEFLAERFIAQNDGKWAREGMNG